MGYLKLLKKMKKCEKVLKRIKGDKISGVVKMNIKMFKMEIGKMDNEIEFLVLAHKVINDSDYEFEIN